MHFLPTVELTNTQIALQGIEQKGFALASSHVAQVFGSEHKPQLRDGDVFPKKSWMGKVLDLQVSPPLPHSVS